MRIVLDTNVLLISLPTKSKYRPIFDSLISSKFELVISNEIISEYMEIIEQKTNSTIASNVIELLLNQKNVKKVEVYFRWGLIVEDYDDNKFVDCAISSASKYIVTDDKHFNVLKKIPFPKVDIISIDEFLNEIIIPMNS
ncbi:MAG: putative toxin-antitoxin system toxin component, PIN family [Bacteroidales bacterium]|nr:putative toxin-antitoxin system toxin component, PIN family [Bacteroidales bacterium]MCF8456516.1 putative toxin-antitoxin system toxin component, PIN family [Bacteroidales bacterium]